MDSVREENPRIWELSISPETHREHLEMDIPKEVIDVCQAIRNAGGRAMIVGGSVRDAVYSREYPDKKITPKDFDIEVYGLKAEALHDFLSNHFGKEAVMDVGKDFGIVKINIPGFSEPLDFSLPRRESKRGQGHKGFETNSDPFMSLEEAAKRRDITINSMAYDPLEETVYDPFGGIKDIQARIIRATDYVRFTDDPLRVLRLPQFRGRFEFEIEEGTKALSKKMLDEGELDINDTGNPEAKGLSRERIAEEFVKLMLKSKRPSLGFRFLQEIGYLEKFLPELDALQGIPQEPDWHPEGDVFEHTMQVIDAAIKILKEEIAAGRLLTKEDWNEIDTTIENFYQMKLVSMRRQYLSDLLWIVDEEAMHDLKREARYFQQQLMDKRMYKTIESGKRCGNPHEGKKLLALEAEARSATRNEYLKFYDNKLNELLQSLVCDGRLDPGNADEVLRIAEEASIKVAERERLILTKYTFEEKSLVLMFGALGHDLGKRTTTEIIDGRITSHNHEAMGVEPMRQMMRLFNKMRCFAPVQRQVLPLVAEHLKPGEIHRMAIGTLRKDGTGAPNERGARKALRKVNHRLENGDSRSEGNSKYPDGGGTNMYMLCMVAKADHLGRNKEGRPYTDQEKIEDLGWYDWVLNEYYQLKLAKEDHVEEIVTGQRVLDVLGKSGKEAGPWVKVIMACVNKDFDEEIITELEIEEQVRFYYAKFTSHVARQISKNQGLINEKNVWIELGKFDSRTVLC